MRLLLAAALAWVLMGMGPTGTLAMAEPGPKPLGGELATSQPPRPLTLAPRMDGIALGRHLAVAFDEPGEADAARRRASEQGFSVWGRDDVNLGVSRRTTWLRLQVRNPGDAPLDWVLDLGDALIEHATLHQQGPDGRWHARTVGTRHPWAARDVPIGRIVFQLSQPGRSERLVLLQIESGFGQRLAMQAWDAATFHRELKEGNLLRGSYLGLLLSLGAYHLLLWGLLRQPAYLAYTALLASTAASQALFWSIGTAWLWPDGSAALGLWAVLGFELMHLCALWVARTGLNLKRLAPRWARISTALMAVVALLMAVSPWLDQMARSAAANLMALVVQLAVLAMALWVGLRGDQPARWFAAGWLCLITGGLLWALRNLGAVPDNDLTATAGPVGMALNALLLAGALAARVRQGEAERIQVQNALARLQQDATDALEHRVRERTAELQTSRDEAEATNRMKDLFVRLVSHDLRSPLASIVAATDRADAGPDTLAGIRHSARGLIRLIDELLDLDRLRSGRMPLQRVHFGVAPWVEARLARLQALADGQGITLDHTVPASLRLFGSPALLGEVLANLLGNALKVCGPGDRVVVDIDTDGRSLVVRDSGPGFGTRADDAPAPYPAPPDAAPAGEGPRVVERRRKPRPPPGRHGHGLRYGREIMAAHGGDLEVRDSPEGATVIMRLPGTGPRVLVVDGDARERDTLIESLRAAWPGCECTAAADDEQALDQLARQACDLVVTEMQLPRGDGLQLLRRLRTDARWDTLPVLLVAQVANTEALAERELEAAAAGADGFLAWPVEVDQLARALEAVFTYEAE